MQNKTNSLAATPANTPNNAPQKEWVSPRIDISSKEVIQTGRLFYITETVGYYLS